MKKKEKKRKEKKKKARCLCLGSHRRPRPWSHMEPISRCWSQRRGDGGRPHRRPPPRLQPTCTHRRRDRLRRWRRRRTKPSQPRRVHEQHVVAATKMTANAANGWHRGRRDRLLGAHQKWQQHSAPNAPALRRWATAPKPTNVSLWKQSDGIFSFMCHWAGWRLI